jgi:hypothetical protein
MTPVRNAFAALCALASTERWCWNINCTTCGHGCFRYGFYEISRGRHSDADGWLTRKDSLNTAIEALGEVHQVTAAIRQSATLYQVVADAPLASIGRTAAARRCSSRDW